MEENSLNYHRIQKAIEFLSDNFKQQPRLEDVAEQVHLSPFHFQKMFTEWAGVSPKKFLQFLTTHYLKEQIRNTSSILEAADLVGLSSQSRVYDLFVNLEAVTPHQYRHAGKGLKIYYAYHDCPFGICFIAVTERGICGLEFLEEDQKEVILTSFAQRWHFAKLEANVEKTTPYLNQIFDPYQRKYGSVKVLIQGTNFQIKVWEALLKIPFGSVSTYAQIAQSIGNPQAVRAVGTAIGKNPVAYLIPCHRIIRKEGKLGGYHWGSERKKAIIGWEAAKSLAS